MRSAILALFALFFIGHGATQAAAAVAPDRNLLVNPGFEQADAAWSAEGAARRYEIVPGTGRNGTAALRYRKTPSEKTAKENSHWDQQVTLKPGEQYVAAVWVRGDGVLCPTLRVAGQDWTTLALARSPASTDWRRTRVHFQAPTDGKVRFQLFGGGDRSDFRAMAPGTAWFDDALLCAAEAAPELRPSCRIEVDAKAQGRKINPLFFGVNSLFMIEDDDALADPRLAARLRELPCRLIRFPGGEMADNYHWQTQTLDNPKKWPFRAGPDTTDTDEFMKWCRTIGAEPIFVVNLESWAAKNDIAAGTREAVAWVRYCNIEKGYRIRYWEVGNETYLKGTFHPMTARQYAEAFVEYAEAMKAVDPTIVVGAVGPRGVREIAVIEQGTPGAQAWWPTVRKRAGALLGMAVVHQYIRVPAASDMPWANLSAGPDSVRELRKFLDVTPATRTTLIALTEWNVAGPDSHGMAQVLHLSELTGAYLAAGVDMATFWPLRISPKSRKWGKNALLTFDSKAPMPAYAALHLFARYAAGRIVGTTVSGTVAVRTVACADPSTHRLALFVINKGTGDTVSHATIDIAGLPDTVRFEQGQVLMAGAAPESPVRQVSGQAVPLPDHSGWRWPLPPFSVSLLQFRW